MSNEEESPEELLETAVEEVSDGEASDWDVLIESARSDRERQRLKDLRVVSRIADVHRSLQDDLLPGPCLAIREPNGVAWYHLLGQDPVSIGRSSTNYIMVQKISLSRMHARVWREGKQYLVEDLGSRNGTWVNGVRLQARHELLDGDEIRIGACRITFRIGGQSQSPGVIKNEGGAAPEPDDQS